LVSVIVLSGPCYGKQNRQCGINRKQVGKVSKSKLSRNHKRRWFILTAGRWPWKLESAKKCVIAYLPNELALEMDDAKATYFSHAVITFFVSDDE
jgi:hypothetical protein